MEVGYHILFSIMLKNSRFGDNPVPGISLSPTESCRVQLLRYGAVFKNNLTGGFVGIEKRKDQDGNIFPLRPWKQVVDFTFLIKTENYSLLARTKPYNNTSFVCDLSSSYLMYCDNLDANNKIDQSEVLTSSEVLSVKDIFFLTSTSLSFSEVDEVRYTPFFPGASLVRETPEQRGQTGIDIRLDNGAYTLTRLLPAGTKTDLIVAGLVGDTSGVIGVIRIFKDQDVNYEGRQRYTLSMEGVV